MAIRGHRQYPAVVYDFVWAEVEGPGRIAIRPRPEGWERLEGEMAEMKARGVDILVSLLEDMEASRLGLAEERAAAEATGITFLQFPIRDHSTPAVPEEAIAFATDLAARYQAGESIVLHCFAGIGRSALMAIATLVKAGVDLETASNAMSESRGLRVPETRAQYAFLEAVQNG